MNANAVSHLLESRPDYWDLVNAGIIKDDATGKTPALAPRLQPLAAKLERKMNADAVAHLLESRPDYWDLVDAGIIKDNGPTSVAPSLAARKSTLEKKMVADSISSLLDQRPDVDEMLRRRVLLSDPTVGKVAPALQARRRDLEHEMLRRNLEEQLEARPAPHEITQSSVFEEADDDWIEDYVRRRSMIEGYRAARRESWGKQGFADAAAQYGDSVDDYYYDEATSRAFDEEAEDSTDADSTDYRGYDDEEAAWTKRASAQGYGVDSYSDEDDKEGAGEEFYGDYEYDYEDVANGALSDSTLRRRFGIALKGTAMLYRENLIDAVHKAALKELILRADKRVLAAVEVYEADQDDSEILDTLQRIARRGVSELSGL
mmetsp:Transcript_72210/g.174916  ORF Transcript_72210/g.174916 Transcript_72210/m.174916 type:complete len:375 (+) Transcript_72210:3-1127(+)